MDTSQDICNLEADGDVRKNRLPENCISSTSSSSGYRLFDRDRSIHQIVGGGKAADVILWKRWHISFGIIIAATVGWLLFEWSGLSFLSLCSDVLLIFIIFQFIRANYAVFRNKQLQPLPELVLSESENSSEATKLRAKALADEIGSWHLDVCIDAVVSSLLTLFQKLTGKRPRYKVDGGSNTENLGLQNIQARIRMVLAFMLASLMPWVHNKSGFYLVLGSSNVDEALRGYLTKYDCSSADINPIGGISKQDLRAFLRWASTNLGYVSLTEIEAAPPTAELEPMRSNYNQLDEVDMGMTYEELSIYGRMRKIFRCGPVSMFQNLCYKWGGRLTLSEVADKVKHFFKYYSINRHKMTVLTPSYHAESYSPEDNRFDLRQFLYNSRWPYQFRKIDELVCKFDGDEAAITRSSEQEKLGAASNVGVGMGVVSVGSSDPKAGI